MTAGRSWQALLLGATILGAVAWLRWSASRPASQLVASAVIPVVRSWTKTDADTLAAIEAATVANDPFRLSNTPPTVRYDPAADGVVAGFGPALPPAPRPTLVLKGIVGGPPWQAIIDGIPGRELGTVARQGSVYDRLVILSVTRDSVIIRSPDTTWVLSFRKGS